MRSECDPARRSRSGGIRWVGFWIFLSAMAFGTEAFAVAIKTVNGLSLLGKFVASEDGQACQKALEERVLGTPITLKDGENLFEKASVVDPTTLYELSLDLTVEDRQTSRWLKGWRRVGRWVSGVNSSVKLYGVYLPGPFIATISKAFGFPLGLRLDGLETLYRFFERYRSSMERAALTTSPGLFVFLDAQGVRSWQSLTGAINLDYFDTISSATKPMVPLGSLGERPGLDFLQRQATHAMDTAEALTFYVQFLGKCLSRWPGHGEEDPGMDTYSALVVPDRAVLRLMVEGRAELRVLTMGRSVAAQPWVQSHRSLMESLFFSYDTQTRVDAASALPRYVAAWALWFRGRSPLLGPASKLESQAFYVDGGESLDLGNLRPGLGLAEHLWRQYRIENWQAVQGRAVSPTEAFETGRGILSALMASLQRDPEGQAEARAFFGRAARELMVWWFTALDQPGTDPAVGSEDIMEWYFSFPLDLRAEIWRIPEKASMDGFLEKYVSALENRVYWLEASLKEGKLDPLVNPQAFSWVEIESSLALLRDFRNILLEALERESRDGSGDGLRSGPWLSPWVPRLIPIVNPSQGILVRWERALVDLQNLRRRSQDGPDADIIALRDFMGELNDLWSQRRLPVNARIELLLGFTPTVRSRR